MPDARHILTYAQTMAGGGVERAMLRLASGWCGAGRRVTLVLGARDGPLAREIDSRMEVIELESPDYRALRAVGIRSRRCARCHLLSGQPLYRGRRLDAADAARRDAADGREMLQRADAGADHGRFVAAAHRWWLRQHPRFLDAMVAMTPATADELARATAMPADRIAMIPNPPPAMASGTRPVGLPARYLLGVGRLAPQKRWDRAIDALARTDRTLALVILGEGPERAALLARAARLGIADRVILPGHSPDPRAGDGACRRARLTSDYEGVPACCARRWRSARPSSPPIPASASPKSWRRARTGRSCRADDPAALVAAIDHWATPGRARAAPVAMPGADSAARYLALFDALCAQGTSHQRIA